MRERNITMKLLFYFIDTSHIKNGYVVQLVVQKLHNFILSKLRRCCLNFALTKPMSSVYSTVVYGFLGGKFVYP